MSTFMSFIFDEAQVRIHQGDMGSIAITDGTDSRRLLSLVAIVITHR